MGWIIITLRDELQFVDDYICLQTLTSGISVDFRKDIDFSCELLVVPKFILQPLVENAYKYSGNHDKLNLCIRSNTVAGTLFLTVENNGEPVSKERLIQLRDMLKNGSNEELDTSKKHGTALLNIHMCIQLQYGY